MVKVRVGVIGLQGDVYEHVKAMESALGEKGSVVLIRRAGIIPDCDGLVLPGGESTALSRQLTATGIDREIEQASDAGIPVLATCAGLVLVSCQIEGDGKVRPLGLMDATIGRNVFGSQKESFEADLNVEGFDRPYRAVFIRAPAIVSTGKAVRVLAKIGKNGVAAQQKNLLGLSFHPELTDDQRFHSYFLDMMGVT
jgi:pyridoxal 5'-phosphate synthase pdxT subunit